MATGTAKIQISSTRKTSNGCSVAKRVSRTNVGWRRPSSNIAAIDFGTTNCSLAYILPGKVPAHGPNMLPFHGTVYRVPTAILFNKDGSVKAFGATARKKYRALEAEQLLEHPYFEQIKMKLQQDETVNREMKVTAKNGKEYYLVEVIAHILKHLKDELIKKLNASGLKLEATDFDWVITVPAIWRARGKQMMREAGYKAGLCSREFCPAALQVASSHPPERIEEDNPDKVSLALEPECAAVFCQYTSEQQHVVCPQDHLLSTYLIVDIGGGTVDISAHCLKTFPQKHIQVVIPPTGSDYGGSKVNNEFRNFLETLVHDIDFERFIGTPDEVVNAENEVCLNELLNESFEISKATFGDEDDTDSTDKLTIELPFEFLQTYKHDLKQGIVDYGEDQVQLVGQDLRISYRLMSKFFEAIKEQIIRSIASVMEDVKKIEAVYLVGGFGGCKYMENAIQEHFKGKNIKCIVPVEPAYAVVKGAVLHRLNPTLITSRKVDATYGSSIFIDFIDGLHDPKYKWINDDGEPKCKKIFKTIVERGDVVGCGEVFTYTTHPVNHNQHNIYIEFYSSIEKDIFYVTGERGRNSRKQPATVTKIGEITVDMPDLTGDKHRKVDVTFDFSHTEIQVKAFDQTSKNEVKTVLDFLTTK